MSLYKIKIPLVRYVQEAVKAAVPLSFITLKHTLFAPGRTFPQLSLPGLTANGPDSLKGQLCGTLSAQRAIEFRYILPQEMGIVKHSP